jgi:hypothetical protein
VPGSSQFFNRELFAPPPFQETAKRPYQSGSSCKLQDDVPPCSWPTK